MSNLVRITLSRRTGEEISRESHTVTTASGRSWLEAVADILYSRAVRDGIISDPAANRSIMKTS